MAETVLGNPDESDEHRVIFENKFDATDPTNTHRQHICAMAGAFIWLVSLAMLASLPMNTDSLRGTTQVLFTLTSPPELVSYGEITQLQQVMMPVNILCRNKTQTCA